MSDIKLFSLEGEQVTELSSHSADLEKNLQRQIEANMPTFLGVQFLETEYSTGKTHKGRIDSLGLDENGCPVIIEYKRNKNENVINQGLFYLDWLLDHQAEFRWQVMEKLGKEKAGAIEWSGTRLICIAADFNKYDAHAVQQIDRNIELIHYRYFENLLLLELVNAHSAGNHTKRPTATDSLTAASIDAQATGEQDENTSPRRSTDKSPCVSQPVASKISIEERENGKIQSEIQSAGGQGCASAFIGPNNRKCR